MKKQSLFLVLMTLVLTLFAVSSVFAEEPIEGRAGRAEVRFMEGMSDHHQMAIDMAQDCLEKAANEELRAICQNIIDTQSAEVAQMQEWLSAWYNISYTPMPMREMMGMLEVMPMMGEVEGMDHDMMGQATEVPEGMFTDPPMMMGMMAQLGRLEGVEYEIAWMESMIDHHDDAIHMAERLLARVPQGEGHDELRSVAEQIVAAQTAEIEALENLISELSV